MSSNQTSTHNENNTDIAIGVAVVVIGVLFCIARFLYKRRRKTEKNDNISIIEVIPESPKKTAADHIEEIKEAAQKILEPLKINTPKSSSEHSHSHSSSPASKERINEKVKSKNGLNNDSSRHGSKADPRHGSNAGSIPDPLELSITDPLPPPPPPSPTLLKTHNDDNIGPDPIQMTLLDELLSETSSISSLNLPPRIQLRTIPRVRPPSQQILLSSRTSPRVTSRSYFPEKGTNNYTNFQPIQNIKRTKPIRIYQLFNNQEETVIEEDNEMIFYANSKTLYNN